MQTGPVEVLDMNIAIILAVYGFLSWLTTLVLLGYGSLEVCRFQILFSSRICRILFCVGIGSLILLGFFYYVPAFTSSAIYLINIQAYVIYFIALYFGSIQLILAFIVIATGTRRKRGHHCEKGDSHQI